jgi:hypothetical protein
LKRRLHIWQSPLDLLPGKNPYTSVCERNKVLLHSSGRRERK